jgi:hypothetical protein
MNVVEKAVCFALGWVAASEEYSHKEQELLEMAQDDGFIRELVAGFIEGLKQERL